MSLYLYLVVLTICAFCSIYLRKSMTGAFKYLFWLVCITLIVELIGTYSLVNLKKVAGWIYHIFQPIEYLLLALYFWSIIEKVNVKNLILTSIPIVFIFNILNTFFLQNIEQLNTYAFLLVAFFLAIWAASYLYELLNTETEILIWNNPHFWISTGILFFYTGAFFLMGFINIVLKNNPILASKLFVINHILNILLYGLYTYGFICQNKLQKSS